MTYALDAELLQVITAKFAAGAMTLPEPAARDDWKTLRANGEAALAAMEAELPAHPEVSRTAYSATSHDSAPVQLRWYAPAGHDPSHTGPAAADPECSRKPHSCAPLVVYLYYNSTYYNDERPIG